MPPTVPAVKSGSQDLETHRIKLASALKFDKITNLDEILTAQTVALNNLFGYLLTQSLTDPRAADPMGVMLALRAQKQCRNTAESLRSDKTIRTE